MATFSKVTERDKLKPRRDPYWQRMMGGCYLGYRKMTATSDGNWSARFLDETKTPAKQVYKALGDFSELPASQRHDAAHEAATEWFKHLGKGGSVEAVTVRAVCARYVEQQREKIGERAAKDAQDRFNSYVLDKKNSKLATTELANLTPAHIDVWRKALQNRPTTSGPRRGEKRSKSSLNRDMTCFRAALNLAFKDGLVTSNFAWHSKLIPHTNADQKKNAYLDTDQRRKLTSNAPDDLAQLLRALSLVPLRPGAMAALTVASYDKAFKSVSIGKDKAGQGRKITLPDSTAAFFAAQCANKLPGAPLLARSNGKAWDKDAWKYPIRDAVAKAGLPGNVTLYTMRHSVITDLVHSGLDLLTVAQLSGTSLKMIEQHYGHLTDVRAKEALGRLSL